MDSGNASAMNGENLSSSRNTDYVKDLFILTNTQALVARYALRTKRS
jgi:hypothetical protein